MWAKIIKLRLTLSPSFMISGTNDKLRGKLLTGRDNLTPAEQDEKSEQIILSLIDLPQVQQASNLFVYVNFRSEVQTVSFIKKCLQENKTVTVPVTRVAEKNCSPYG